MSKSDDLTAPDVGVCQDDPILHSFEASVYRQVRAATVVDALPGPGRLSGLGLAYGAVLETGRDAVSNGSPVFAFLLLEMVLPPLFL